MTIKSILMATAGLLLSVASASAGPFIISGTDSDDHGSVSGGVNQGGWLYMQKAIENIAGGVTNGFKNIVTLGSDTGTQAGNAAASAFGLSSIAGTWTMTNINTDTNINSFFAGTGAVNVNNTGILLIDSGDNVAGGIDFSEDAALTANAAAINAFVGAGGGLFAQASDLGWLTALIPGVTITDIGTGGDGSALLLTAAGSAAFPGLTNGDLSSGPWHHYFGNYSPLSLLAQSDNDHDVVIGASGGSITDPNPPTNVPEPITLTLFGAGLVGAAALRRRKSEKKA